MVVAPTSLPHGSGDAFCHLREKSRRHHGCYLVLMLGGGLFFLDQFVNESRCSATAEAARWLVFSFALWVTHEAFVERLFGSHEVIIIKRELAALAAL